MPHSLPTFVETYVEAASRLPVVGLLIRAWMKGERDLVRDMSASIAYFTVLSLFPLALGLIAIGSFFLDSADIQIRVNEFIVELLPVGGSFVTRNIENLVRLRGAAGLVSIAVLMWSASRMVGALSRGINGILGFDRPYEFYMSPLRNISLTFTVAILLLFATALMPTLELLSELELGFLGGRWNALIQLIGGRTASFLISAVLLVGVYALLPYERPMRKDLVMGALVAALLIEVGKVLFALYVGTVSRFDAVYGSVSSIIVLLIWLYFSARVVLYGTEVICESQKSRQQK